MNDTNENEFVYKIIVIGEAGHSFFFQTIIGLS